MTDAVRERMPHIIGRIRETITYFDDEFSKEIVSDADKLYANLDVWKQPLCQYAGGVTANDLLDILAAQADTAAIVDELVKALKDAHFELNAIRARDGAPQHIDWCGGRPLQTSSCTHEWFNTVVEQCEEALNKAEAWRGNNG